MNLRELVDKGDPIEVAAKIGMRMVPTSRGRMLVECPSHLKNLGKEDTRLGNCYITPKGYCCFACNAKGNFIQMAADFWKMPYETFEDKVAVASRICEEVYPQYKMYSDHGKKDTSIKKDDMILTPEEIEYIGLSAYVPVQELDTEQFEQTGKEKMKTSSSYSTSTFMRDDPIGFIFMAFGKAYGTYLDKIITRDMYLDYDMSMYKSPEHRTECLRKAEEEIAKAHAIGDKLEKAIDTNPDMTYEEKQEFKRMLKSEVIDAFVIDTNKPRIPEDKICVIAPSGDAISGEELIRLGLLRLGTDMNGETSLEYVSPSLTGTLIANDISTVQKKAFVGSELSAVQLRGTTSIEQEAFKNSKIREVFIDNNPIYIEENAFLRCTKLESVEFARPNDVMEIKEGAFAECKNLRELRIGEHTVFNGPEKVRVDRVADMRQSQDNLPQINISVVIPMKNLNFSPDFSI